jgi:hypothetical protein
MHLHEKENAERVAVVLCYSNAGRYTADGGKDLDCRAEEREKEREREGGGANVYARARVTARAWLMMDRSISSSSENASARTRKRTRKLGTEFFSLTKSFSSPNQKYIESVTLSFGTKNPKEKTKWK